MLAVRDSQMRSMAADSPGKQIVEPCENAATWIEIRVVDQDGNPVPRARYRLRLPDSSIQEGSLDDEGKARYERITPGQAEVQFPDFDGREWAALQ